MLDGEDTINCGSTENYKPCLDPFCNKLLKIEGPCISENNKCGPGSRLVKDSTKKNPNENFFEKIKNFKPNVKKQIFVKAIADFFPIFFLELKVFIDYLIKQNIPYSHFC